MIHCSSSSMIEIVLLIKRDLGEGDYKDLIVEPFYGNYYNLIINFFRMFEMITHKISL